MKHIKPFAVLIFSLSITACSTEEVGEAAPLPTANFKATGTMHDFMVWNLEPAADVIWDSAGFVVTAEGETDLQPTTEAGWNGVRHAATVVADGGNLMLTPPYTVAERDWQDYATGLIDAGLKARDAAIAQDAEALFDAGGQVYNVCRACHNRYANFSPNAIN